MMLYLPSKLRVLLSSVFLLLFMSVRSSLAQGEDAPCIHCPEYYAASAAVKMERLWSRITTSEYDQLPPIVSLCFAQARIAEFDSETILSNIFDRFSDERPLNWPKFFHFVGVAAQVRYVPSTETSHPFTGLFQSGADNAIWKFSPLAPTLSEGFLSNYFIGTFFFSFGLKMLRSGVHSGNFVTGDAWKERTGFTANRNIWDRPNFNIFSRPTDNMPSIGTGVGVLFEENERFSGVLGTGDVAAYDQDGNEVENPVAPLILSFRPNPELTERFGRVGTLDFRQWLLEEDAIPVGTTLYSAVTTVDTATGMPSLCLDDQGVPQVDDDVQGRWCPDMTVITIGEVVTTSRLLASDYVDNQLWFQHTRMCPKDQAVCQFDQAESPERPDSTFPFQLNQICASDRDKEGFVSGIPATCPFGSAVANGPETCFPGARHRVPDIQTFQCPFMDAVLDELKFAIPDEDEDDDSNSCTFTGQLSNVALEGFLFVFANVARTLEAVFGLFG